MKGACLGVQPLRTPQSHLSLPTRPFPCGTSSGAHSLLQAPVRPGTRVAGVETPVPNLLAWVSGLFSTELEFSQPWLASPASRTGVESGEGEKGAARRTKGSNLTLAPSPCVQPRGGTTEATDPTDVTKGFRLQSLPPPPGPRFVLFVDFSAPPKAGTPGAISFLPLRSLPGVSTAPWTLLSRAPTILYGRPRSQLGLGVPGSASQGGHGSPWGSEAERGGLSSPWAEVGARHLLVHGAQGPSRFSGGSDEGPRNTPPHLRCIPRPPPCSALRAGHVNAEPNPGGGGGEGGTDSGGSARGQRARMGQALPDAATSPGHRGGGCGWGGERGVYPP